MKVAERVVSEGSPRSNDESGRGLTQLRVESRTRPSVKKWAARRRRPLWHWRCRVQQRGLRRCTATGWAAHHIRQARNVAARTPPPARTTHQRPPLHDM